MGNIRTSISMTDRMTPTLRSVMRAMNSTLKVMQMVDSQASSNATSKAFRQAEKDIQRANNALIQLGNYAQLGNSMAQASTQKTIQQMNLLEVAALGASKAMAKIGESGSMAKAKNFSLLGMFNAIQTKGDSMLQSSRMLNGKLSQALMGSALYSIGSLGSGAMSVIGRIGAVAGPVFSRIGQIASTTFSVARNSMSQFSSFAHNALTSLSSKASIMWEGMASGIYVIKNIISHLSTLTRMTDKVISDMAKLNLFNYSGISSSQVYGLAYQAAQASRTDLSTTSALASRIAMSGVYTEGEGSIESAINIAETINKALAVGGGTAQENERALLQLSQGLSSGRLQGDELRTIREQSPYLASVLAEGLGMVDSSFIGVTAGDLKQLGSEGKLTADVVIRAFEAMEEQINQTFDEKAPKTWSQGVTSIMNTIKFFMGILQKMENGPLQKITNLVWVISDYLKSDEGLQLLANIAMMIGVIGDVLSYVVGSALNLISWLIDNSYILISLFAVLGTAALYSGLSALVAWLSAVWPLLLIIAVVSLIIKIFLDMGITFGEIVGAICGGVMVVIAFFENLGLSIWGILKGVWAALSGLGNNAMLSFQNIGLHLKSFFTGIVAAILEKIAELGMALDSLPYVEFDYSGIANAASEWASAQAEADLQIAANDAAMIDIGQAFTDAYDSVGAFQEGWAADAYDSGYEWGSGIVEGIEGTALELGEMFDPSTLGASLNVDEVSVDGGSLDSVNSIGSDVNISDEDIQLLRDMAARDYLLQLQTITPVANVTFGDVRETADVGKIVEVIEQMVDEQMATALVS